MKISTTFSMNNSLVFRMFFLWILFWLALPLAKSQDSLSADFLKTIAYEFTVENGVIKGSGADFLSQVIQESQYTMVAEYHGSHRISEFTEAIIPFCHQADYSLMALEVGPITGQILQEQTVEAQKTSANLRAINSKYFYPEGEFSSIPFFEYEKDADFLSSVRSKKMNLIGIDQEFANSFTMLADRMIAQASANASKKQTEFFQVARDSIETYLKMDDLGEINFIALSQSSPIIISFLKKMESYMANKIIVEQWKKSIEIYNLYFTRQWYRNNAERILHMKENLRQGMTQNQFDLEKDKMLIKMGAHHLSKGKSPLGFYEVGSTLHELAEFHGNKAVNIYFENRFYMEDDTLRDILIEDPEYSNLIFSQLGSEDKWQVIDLRSLRAGLGYYPLKHQTTESIKSMIFRYDILVILPTELEPVANR